MTMIYIANFWLGTLAYGRHPFRDANWTRDSAVEKRLNGVCDGATNERHLFCFGRGYGARWRMFMSSTHRIGAMLLIFLGLASSGRGSAAEELRFSKPLTPPQMHCLDDLLNAPDQGSEPSEKRELKAAAEVATAALRDNRSVQYIYLFKSSEFCDGGQGLIMIGEPNREGVCHSLWVSGANSVILLGGRDHGYRRFASPCEARFDGQQYQLLLQDWENPINYRPPPGAEDLTFSKHLTPAQTGCLDDLLSSPDWGGSSTENLKLKSDAQVASAVLGENGRSQYIFYFENTGYCSSAGCMMIIGEVYQKHCRMLYDYDSDGSFTVLPARDYGYRRFWSPCEARYDGHQYQLLHEACPNVEVTGLLPDRAA